jgi:signal transduction histidine kinase
MATTVAPVSHNARWWAQMSAAVALTVAAASHATGHRHAGHLLALIGGLVVVGVAMTGIGSSRSRDTSPASDRAYAAAGVLIGFGIALPATLALLGGGNPTVRGAVVGPVLLAAAGTRLLLTAWADPGLDAEVTDRVIELATMSGTLRIADQHSTGTSAGVEKAYAAGVAMLDANRALVSELESQLSQSRALQRRLVTATDTERAHLSAQLSTSVLPLLDELTLTLQSVSASNGHRASSDAANKALLQVEDTCEDLHRIARGLHPRLLSDQGLRAALADLASRAPIGVTTSAPVGRFGSAAESTLWYVCAEALTNTVKHSGATHATIKIEQVGDQLVSTARDNGRCPPDISIDLDPTGGLAGARDRVVACGGSLDIAVSSAGGLSVVARVPC